MTEQKIFCIYGCFSASYYIKGGRNHIFRHNWIFRHTSMYKPPTLILSGITIFLCKYYIIIFNAMAGSFLDVLFLLLAVIFSELREKPSFLCQFLLLSSSSSFPFLSDVFAPWNCARGGEGGLAPPPAPPRSTALWQHTKIWTIATF